MFSCVSYFYTSVFHLKPVLRQSSTVVSPAFYPPSEQAAEKQVSSLRKERDAAQSRVDDGVRGLESLGYDKTQEDGLDGEKEQEEKAVDRLKEVRPQNCKMARWQDIAAVGCRCLTNLT